jgi:hypothetical protein
MRKRLIRILALYILILGLVRIIQYILNPKAQLGFLGVRLFNTTIDFTGLIGTAILLYVGVKLFALKESGRTWVILLIGIFLVLNVIGGLYALIIGHTTLKIRLPGLNLETSSYFYLFLFLSAVYFLPVAVLIFLMQSPTRALFHLPDSEDLDRE